MIGFPRDHSGDRFYNPPAIRRLKQQQQEQQRLQQQQEHQRLQQQQEHQQRRWQDEEEHRRRQDEEEHRRRRLQEEEQRQWPPVAKPGPAPSQDSRVASDRPPVVPAAASLPAGNLDRFLKSTTPVVPARLFSKASGRVLRSSERESNLYFCLGDLWESFKEWSAYGAGVPLVLNGSDSVVQYYVPYLSGMQLYVDPSRPPSKPRRLGEENYLDSSWEAGSDGSDSDIERYIKLGLLGQQSLTESSLHNMNRLSLRDKPLDAPEESSSDDGETATGSLAFEYLERDPPYSREPLADKISALASQFPQLKSYMSCDLLPRSWISVAWYPIYRIPTGPTLRDLEACFLTYHTLSTQSRGSNNNQVNQSMPRIKDDTVCMFPKLLLPVFGLASYKFKVSIWTSDWPTERQQAVQLMQIADSWLRNLNVLHPDFMFFASHGTYQR